MLIQIHPANPDWPRRFQAIEAALSPALPGCLAIHHIGSTAVPGLVAKDMIDIQVTVPSLSAFDPLTLERPGFPLLSPTGDHAPDPGARRACQAHGRQTRTGTRQYPNPRGRALQPAPHALCREYLRNHPLAAAAYGAIKPTLARLFSEDAESCSDIKDPVFDLVLAGAEDWARATGWTIPRAD